MKPIIIIKKVENGGEKVGRASIDIAKSTGKMHRRSI